MIKSLFLTSISLALIISSLSVAYYFTIFLSDQEKVKAQQEQEVLSATSGENEKPFNGKSAFDILDEYEAKLTSGAYENTYVADPDYKTRNDIENLDIKLQMEAQQREHLENTIETDKTWDLYCASTGRVHDGYYNCR